MFFTIRKAANNSAFWGCICLFKFSLSCLLFNVPICDILNFSGQVSVYFLHLIFVLQDYAVPIVLLCGYFGWVWRRLLGTWRLVLLRELLPPFLKTRRTYFKHSPNIKGPPCQDVFQKNNHRSRLKELPDQEKKIPRWRCQIKLGQDVSSTTINNPFLCFSRMVPLQRHEVSTFRVCIVHSSSTIRKHPVLQNPALSSTSHLPLLATGLCCAGIFHGFKIQ